MPQSNSLAITKTAVDKGIQELDAALAAVFLGIQKVGKNKEYPCERRRVVAFESPTHLCCDIDTDVRMLLRFLLQTNFCVNNCHCHFYEFDPNLILIPVTTNSRLTEATLTAMLSLRTSPGLCWRIWSPGSWMASSASQCSACPWSQVKGIKRREKLFLGSGTKTLSGNPANAT